ncbi:hypothetical protein R3P38DRAFT_1086252 [Favolaschia claudopus]|uniref:Uncharacterized protein n=1 Tax=Favolaschia claudopus TaxID=2862362 RepID=A0AAW0BC58_9AGAR
MQFTHVETLVVEYVDYLSEGEVPLLRNILSFPNLVRIRLRCDLNDKRHFACLWSSCSPALRHLSLITSLTAKALSSTSSPTSSSMSAPAAAATLESLQMLSWDTCDYQLIQDSPLLDLSQLTFLRVGWRTRIPWPDFAPVVQTIQTLHIVLNFTATSIPLCSFPRLTTLRLCLPDWIPAEGRVQMADQLFSNIGPSNVVQRIILAAKENKILDGPLRELLDSKLSCLPMAQAPMIALEMTPNRYEGIWPFFIRLNSANMLCRVDELGETWSGPMMP